MMNKRNFLILFIVLIVISLDAMDNDQPSTSSALIAVHHSQVTQMNLSGFLNAHLQAWKYPFVNFSAALKSYRDNPIAKINSIIEDNSKPTIKQKAQLKEYVTQLTNDTHNEEAALEVYESFLLFHRKTTNIAADYITDKKVNPYFHFGKLGKGAATLGWGMLSLKATQYLLQALSQSNQGSLRLKFAFGFFLFNTMISMPTGIHYLFNGLYHGQKLDILIESKGEYIDLFMQGMNKIACKFPNIAEKHRQIDSSLDALVPYRPVATNSMQECASSF